MSCEGSLSLFNLFKRKIEKSTKTIKTNGMSLSTISSCKVEIVFSIDNINYDMPIVYEKEYISGEDYDRLPRQQQSEWIHHPTHYIYKWTIKGERDDKPFRLSNKNNNNEYTRGDEKPNYLFSISPLEKRCIEWNTLYVKIKETYKDGPQMKTCLYKIDFSKFENGSSPDHYLSPLTPCSNRNKGHEWIHIIWGIHTNHTSRNVFGLILNTHE